MSEYITLTFTPKKSLGTNNPSWSLINSSNNTCQIQLPNNLNFKTNDEVCLNSLSFTYSFYNLTSQNNNNNLSYIWVDSLTYSVTFSDGNYSIYDMTCYIQQIMLGRGHCLFDGDSNPVYYLSLIANRTYLTTTLTLTPLPSSLPTNWTNPGNWTLGTTCRLIIPNTSIQEITGLNASTYPSTPSTTLYQINSQNTPQLNPVKTINLNSNIINDPSLTSTYPNSLLTFSAASYMFGEMIHIQPHFPIWFKCVNTPFNTITLSLTDQDNSPLNLQLNDIVAILYIRR
jgi:hypothetical protein